MKKNLLIMVIASFCFMALIGIFIIILGTWGELESKIFMTTAIMGLFALLSLFSNFLAEKNKELAIVSKISMIISCLGAIWFLASTWEIITESMFSNYEDYIKYTLTFLLLPFYCTHLCLVLLLYNKQNMIKIMVRATLVVSTINVVMIMIVIWVLTTIDSFDYYELMWRMVAVASILTILGTIVTPIMNKVMKYKEETLKVETMN